MQNKWYKKSLVFGMFLMLVFTVFAAVPMNVSAETTIEPVQWEPPFRRHTIGGYDYYEDVHAADVDGDGVNELLAGSWYHNRVEVWDYDASTGLWTMVSYSEQPYNIRGICTGDFDEDGDLDIVTAIRFYGMYISFNTGSGWSAAVQFYPQYGSTATTCDLNGDGHLDVFARLDSPGQAKIFYGNGDGTFTADTNPIGLDDGVPNPSMPAWPYFNMYPADLDGDGDQDLYGSWVEGGWWWYPGDRRDCHVRGFINKGNDGSGKVIWGVAPTEVLGYYTGSLGHSGYWLDSRQDACGDVNGDGYMDFVALKQPQMEITLLTGYDSGGGKISWQEQTIDTFTSGYHLSQMHDINGDGHLDIITGSGGQYSGTVNNLHIYYGDGTGNFIKVTHILSYGAFGASFTFGDFNDDGLTDISFGRSTDYADGFEVWLQKSNQPPVADAGGPYETDEGEEITFDASGSSDPDDDPLTYAWDLDDDGFYDDETGATPTISWSILVSLGLGDDGTYTIGLEVDDGMFTDTESTTVTVNNVAPTITSLIVTPGLVAVGDPVTLDATFTDPGTLDTHTAEIDWDNDGTYETPITVTSPIQVTHSYADAGVYTVKLKVTDDDGGFDTEIFQYVVVYDPSAGFVTGGGWINSPVGAYAADPLLEGTANFGFVSKYKKGQSTPTGSTEFQYQIGNLNFHSSSYDWLVITHHKAMYKGTGTINGAGNYGFMISAIDEKLTTSTDDDMFRIKIWDKDNSDAVVYDNGLGDPDDADPATAIAGGQIVIHKK